MKKLIVATGNKGKLREISEILGDRYQVVSMKEAGFDGDIEENGSTFYENALIKARTVSERLGVDALADDSGLCVNALGGAPGIYSARFGGEHGNDALNRKVLLEKMQGKTDRSAYFACYVVLYRADGSIVCGSGQTEGSIMLSEKGNGGFGYDSLFFSDDLKKSFAQATEEEKNSVSHRYRAIIDLLGHL
ncbi:MAG: RdgB/HAM1 family non-canonical purine NTP pyrophosphatase [Clostridia bacterium]|nr:RdgB/HAM1 family non-canonical purine NTP pyrophosphatase [Clostridia bacterium]